MKMKKRRNSNTRLFRERAYMVAFAVCLVAAFSLLGVYALRSDKNSSDEYKIDLTELENQTDNKEEARAPEETPDAGREVTVNDGVTAENYTNEEPFGWDNVMDATDEAREVQEGDEIILEENVIADVADIADETDVQAAGEEETSEVSGGAVDLSFGANASMRWPVQGNVILNYSMDKTVFFSTLQQYKYNPAIVVSSPVNTPVVAARKGVVEEIRLDDETGTTVVMNIGDGYRVSYGQLGSLKVAKGDVVEAGEVIGAVAAPTKYYSVEGSNLYLKLEKDGSCVNPMNFLE